MKKTLSMLLAGAMLATALTGCGGSASSSSDSQNSGSDSTASGTAFKKAHGFRDFLFLRND